MAVALKQGQKGWLGVSTLRSTKPMLMYLVNLRLKCRSLKMFEEIGCGIASMCICCSSPPVAPRVPSGHHPSPPRCVSTCANVPALLHELAHTAGSISRSSPCRRYTICVHSVSGGKHRFLNCRAQSSHQPTICIHIHLNHTHINGSLISSIERERDIDISILYDICMRSPVCMLHR